MMMAIGIGFVIDWALEYHKYMLLPSSEKVVYTFNVDRYQEYAITVILALKVLGGILWYRLFAKQNLVSYTFTLFRMRLSFDGVIIISTWLFYSFTSMSLIRAILITMVMCSLEIALFLTCVVRA